MAIKLGKQISIGKGVSGYEFEIVKTNSADREIYERGLQIEKKLKERTSTSNSDDRPDESGATDEKE